MLSPLLESRTCAASNWKHALALGVLLTNLSGCAAITASSTDDLRVISTPAAALVRVDGNIVGATPRTVEVTRKRPEAVEVMAPGFHTQQCQVRMSAGGGYIAADIILCVLLFPIGCISFIDAGGSWNTLDQTSCAVTLIPDLTHPAVTTPPVPAPAAPAG
jgi:putative lipoic acid-binding regulatory protein